MESTELYKRGCIICGAPLPKYRRKYCSDECAKLAPRMSSLSKTERKPHAIICQDCGEPALVFTRSTRCPDCQRNYVRGLKAKFRKIGSEAICEKCGKPYIVNSGNQRYCKDCAEEVRRERAREINLVYSREYRAKYSDKVRQSKLRIQVPITCVICGREFVSREGALTCSEDCRREWKRILDREWRKRKS